MLPRELIEELIKHESAGFILEITRILAVLIVAPLPWSSIPARFRAGACILIAFAAHGQTPPDPAAVVSIEATALAIGWEFAIGAAIGMVVRFAIGSVEIAASSMAPMTGMGAAQIFDKGAGTSANVLSGYFRNLAVLLAVLMGLHRVVLAATLHSFQVIPPGTFVDISRASPELLALSAHALNTGVRIAMPLIAVIMTTQLSLAFVSRAAPALQIFSIGFAVTLCVSCLVFVTFLPDFARTVVADLSHVGTRIEDVLGLLAGL